MSALGLVQAAGQLGRLGLGIARAQRAAGHNADSNERVRTKLADLMAEQRGLASKLGQLMATGTDDALARCHNQLSPLPLDAMTAVLNDEWHRDHTAVLASIQPAQAAASFGQVHHATLHDGREVALKIRYPEIDQSLKQELALIGMTPKVGPMRRWGFELGNYKPWLTTTLTTELDYTAEAAIQHRYRTACGTCPENITIPTIIHAWCRESILMQSWEAGCSLSTVSKKWSATARRSASETFVRHVLRQSLRHGFVHADLHPGNVALRNHHDQAEVILYDFGCVLELSERERGALIHLLDGLTEQRRIDPAACLEAFGFDRDKLSHLTGRIPAVCELLCRPFLHDRPFDLTTWDLDGEMAAILGEHAWWFRSAGPPRFLLVMRAMRGLVQMVRELGVNINWHAQWLAVADDVRNHTPNINLPDSLPDARTCADLARSLRILITRDGRPHVDLAMPIGVLSDIGSVMDDDLRQRIAEQGTNLDHLVTQAIADGYPIGDLFTCTRDHDRIRVSLA